MIVVAILAIVVIGFIAWARVPDMAANHLSKKLKVPVKIDDVSLGWQNLRINDVEIGNPPKSILPRAFACREIAVMAPFLHFLNKDVVIDEIDVNDVYLGLEFDSATSTNGNWTRIMSNMNSSSDSGNTQKKNKTPQPTPTTERTVLIRRLVLNNINVDVLYRKDGSKVKKLPTINQIVLTNVSSEGGLPMDQVMNSVLGQMLRSVFEKENLKNMLQDLIQQPGNQIQQWIQPFKGFFNANPESTEASPFSELAS